MSEDQAILFVKPQAISADDKDRLEKAGVIVVEVDDPANVKLTRASPEIPTSTLLAIACDAIANSTTSTRDHFAAMICAAIVRNGAIDR